MMLGLFSAFILALATVGEAKVMPVWNAELSPLLEDKYRTLPVKKVVKENTWTNTVPVRCWEAATSNGCAINDLHVFEAWFEDADKPWVICRCKVNAPHTKEEFLTEIGRVPVAIRQRTRYFMLFNGGGGAYSFDKDVVFTGTITPTKVMHEVAHAFDEGKSGQQIYKDAIEKDTCWADNYAKSSGENGAIWEPWAQMLVIHQYMTRIGPLPKNSNCLANQAKAISLQVASELNAGYNPALMRPYGEARKRTTSAKFRL